MISATLTLYIMCSIPQYVIAKQGNDARQYQIVQLDPPKGPFRWEVKDPDHFYFSTLYKMTATGRSVRKVEKECNSS